MHRLLVETALLAEESPSLPKEAARHLKVLRPERGERIELFDGKGNSRLYVHGTSLAAVAPIASVPRPSAALTLFACVTKGSRWDWTVEKATELGVTRIVPVISERTIVRLGKDERAAKRDRWLRIAEDAARQSDAQWLPEILPAVDFPESLALVKETTCLVGALVDPPAQPIAAALAKLCGPRSLATFIGPEGDFTPAELAALLEIATPVSFGPTILRAETAALFALSVLSAFSDRRKNE